MPIWQQPRMPWQKLRGKNNDGAITQATTNSGSQKAAPKNKKIQIITDDPAEEDALYFKGYSENLANIIRETTPKFAIGIFGKWGTGKTTLMKMIKDELDKKDSEKILTVWFDAWRYEKEKYLAVIPFLRQIRIALDNDLAKKRKKSRWGVKSRWGKLRRGLDKTFTAFMASSQLSTSLTGSPVSTTIDLGKLADSLKSKGSTWYGGENVQFHEHATDYLKDALKYLDKQAPGTRIVVFVDDLDRCTPQNALDVIESIKAFFDIEGIVYVVGMDYESIDHIIKQKYQEAPNIDGLSYLQKIVQLQFEIPAWKPQDLSKSISEIISKGLGDSKLVDEFLKGKKIELIVKAVEPNPRQVKRFVNNIILANAVFGQDPDIKFDKLIAVQALNFRTKWNKFFKLISENDATRKTFFEEYYIPPKGKGRSIRSKDALDSFIKEQSDANRPLPEEIKKIFQELIIEQKDDSLKSFLDLEDAGAAEILRDIVKMEDYLRALEATKSIEEKLLTGKQRPTDEQLFELLKTDRVEEFNEMRIQYPIIPNFSGADLSGADLSDADLSRANLFRADLSGAKLSGAKLSHANLFRADLFRADLSAADLSGADLSLANLSRVNLSLADLSHANLSGAALPSSIIIGVKYEVKNLKCADADFGDAIIVDEELSMQLREGKAKNVPSAVRRKEELREKLEIHNLFSPPAIDFLVTHSRLK